MKKRRLENRKSNYLYILAISAISAYFVTMLHPQMDTAPFLYLSSILGLFSLIYAVKYKVKSILVTSVTTVFCIMVHLLAAWIPWPEPSSCAIVCISWPEIITLLGGLLLGVIFGVISLIETLRNMYKHSDKNGGK